MYMCSPNGYISSCKKISEVYVGQPVLSQILKYLGKESVDEISLRHGSDRYTKKLSTYNHLVSLLFGIISRCDSLREIVLLMAAEQMKLCHLSICYKVCRSTLARTPPKIFVAVFRSVFMRNRKFLLDSRRFEAAVANLYAIDSTTVTLGTDILGGTGKPSYKDGRQKGGAKVHVALNVEEGWRNLGFYWKYFIYSENIILDAFALPIPYTPNPAFN